MEQEIVKVCAWCPESERVSELFAASGQLVSHGICPSCEKQIAEELIPVDPEEARV